MSRYTIEYWDDGKNWWQVFDHVEDKNEAIRAAKQASRPSGKYGVGATVRAVDNKDGKTKTIATFNKGWKSRHANIKLSMREVIQELVEQEIEEMTATGDIGGFGTPYAFQGNKEANRTKRRKSAAASGYKVVQNDEANRSFSLDEKFERVVAGATNEATFEKELKTQSNFPGRGEARSYKMPDGSIVWAARNRTGVLKKFHNKKNARKFSHSGLTEAKEEAWRAGKKKKHYRPDLKKSEMDTIVAKLKKDGYEARAHSPYITTNAPASKLDEAWAGDSGPMFTSSQWDRLAKEFGKDPKSDLQGWKKFLQSKGYRIPESVNESVMSNLANALSSHYDLEYMTDYLLKGTTVVFLKGSSLSKEELPGVKNIAKKFGYTVKHSVTEAGDPYYAWRNDESMTPKQKIGRAISEINKQLAEMHKVVKRSSRLKKEMGMSANDYWKRTNNAFLKMEQRMHRISQKIREMRV